MRDLIWNLIELKKNIHNSKKITINALGYSDLLINQSNSITNNRNMSGY
jgi:hypothetical protein